MELIQFLTPDNLPLYGGLWLPKKKTNKCVIYMHGMTDFFYEGELMQAVKNAALKNNHGFFSFNNRGAGIITLVKQKFLGTSFEKFENCLKDIDAALKEMKKRGFKNFILSGHSTGCQKITYFQSKKKRKDVKGLILLSPADDLNFHKKVMGKRFKFSIEFTKNLIKTKRGDELVPKNFHTPFFSSARYYNLFREDSIEGNIFNYSKGLPILKHINCPIFTIFGEEEQFAAIPPKQMLQKIEKSAISPIKTALIKNADHSFHGEEQNVERNISHWLKKF